MFKVELIVHLQIYINSSNTTNIFFITKHLIVDTKYKNKY